MGLRGGEGRVSVGRRLFRRYGVWVVVELSELETLLSLQIEVFREDIFYDEI